jgi:hypothetical protein
MDEFTDIHNLKKERIYDAMRQGLYEVQARLELLLQTEIDIHSIDRNFLNAASLSEIHSVLYNFHNAIIKDAGLSSLWVSMKDSFQLQYSIIQLCYISFLSTNAKPGYRERSEIRNLLGWFVLSRMFVMQVEMNTLTDPVFHNSEGELFMNYLTLNQLYKQEYPLKKYMIPFVQLCKYTSATLYRLIIDGNVLLSTTECISMMIQDFIMNITHREEEIMQKKINPQKTINDFVATKPQTGDFSTLDIEDEVQYFPPCMFHLSMLLAEEKHLKWHEMNQLVFFLRNLRYSDESILNYLYNYWDKEPTGNVRVKRSELDQKLKRTIAKIDNSFACRRLQDPKEGFHTEINGCRIVFATNDELKYLIDAMALRGSMKTKLNLSDQIVDDLKLKASSGCLKILKMLFPEFKANVSEIWKPFFYYTCVSKSKV